MPLPVVVGIPIIAGIIGGLFSSVFSYLATFLTKRFALVAAGIVLIVGVTTAFFASLSSILLSITMVAPPWYSLAVQLVVPDNATFCISAMLSARLLRFAYEWNVKIIQYKLF